MNKTLNKRKIIINVIVILAITLFAFYYLYRKDVLTAESIKSVEWWNYLTVFLYFLLSMFVLALVDFLVYKTITKSMPLHKCFINTLTGNLGSSVTPLKSGHFPLMAYYQYRAGVEVKDTVTGFVKCQILYSATSIMVYSAIVITLAVKGYTVEFNETNVLLWLIVSLGLIFHVAVFVATVVLSFCLPLQKKVLLIWAKLLFKLKRIKNVNDYVIEKTQKLLIFREQITEIVKRFWKYILPSLLYLAHMLLSGTAQYLAYLLISKSSFSIASLFTFYTLNLASNYITNIVPVPGGVGTAEILFTMVFASVIDNSLLGAVVILWRMATFYIANVFSLALFSVSIFFGKRKHIEKTEKNADEIDDEQQVN